MYMPASAMPTTARNPSAGSRLSHSAMPKQERALSALESGGLTIGQAHQRHDGQHIAGGHDAGQPASLRVGQRPGLDELREERRYG
jgi:hypothetical protein